MATSSVLEQYRVSDLVEWFTRKQLRLNPYFQRRNVWSDNARVFLVDTILRRLPMPKVFMRTKVDLTTKQSYREIVDGQQRLRAIVDFANDKIVLSDRAGDLAGLKYSTLPADLQETFLSYAIAVDQLINASDTDVLEIFARLNSYTVSLNPPELRHAQFQGNFKWAVHKVSHDWAILWEKFNVVTVKQRLRMLDDSLVAEMFGVLLEGVKDGGQSNVTKLYKNYFAHRCYGTADKLRPLVKKLGLPTNATPEQVLQQPINNGSCAFLTWVYQLRLIARNAVN